MSKHIPKCKLCNGSKVILKSTPGKNPSVYGRYVPCECVEKEKGPIKILCKGFYKKSYPYPPSKNKRYNALSK